MAGKHGTNRDSGQSGSYDFLRRLFGDFFIGQHNRVRFIRDIQVVENIPADDAFIQRGDNFRTFNKRFHPHAVNGAAIMFLHRHILRDINQTPGKITGVGRLKGRVRKSLARAMGRNEIFDNAQSFPEIGHDGRLDDVPGRLCQQTAHAGELPDLGFTAARLGFVHQMDACKTLPVFLHGFYHGVRNLIAGYRPFVNDLVPPFSLRNQAAPVHFINALHGAFRLGKQFNLAGGNGHVVQRDGKTGKGRVFKTDTFQFVQQRHGLVMAASFIAQSNYFADGTLVLLTVYIRDGNFGSQGVCKQHAAHRGIYNLAVLFQLDGGMNVNS